MCKNVIIVIVLKLNCNSSEIFREIILSRITYENDSTKGQNAARSKNPGFSSYHATRSWFLDFAGVAKLNFGGGARGFLIRI